MHHDSKKAGEILGVLIYSLLDCNTKGKQPKNFFGEF